MSIRRYYSIPTGDASTRSVVKKLTDRLAENPTRFFATYEILWNNQPGKPTLPDVATPEEFTSDIFKKLCRKYPAFLIACAVDDILIECNAHGPAAFNVENCPSPRWPKTLLLRHACPEELIDLEEELRDYLPLEVSYTISLR